MTIASVNQLSSVREIPWSDLLKQTFTPSPIAWEDQVLYFLLVDRFSDKNEDGYLDVNGKAVAGTTPLFDFAKDYGCATQDPENGKQWWDNGGHWLGGKIAGVTSKLGYLRRLGVTGIWASPVFKQVSFTDTYHGYGVQDFLDIDPHFGTKQDLKDLVSAAHAQGIRVILDVILNHSGNVFGYRADRYPSDGGMDPRWDGRPYLVEGFRNAFGQPNLPFGQGVSLPVSKFPNDAVWPVELQADGVFTCKGRINNWDCDPEFREGDFCDLKDLFHGWDTPSGWVSSNTLLTLCEAIKFWIAYADLDGLRIDTVKHMSLGASRYFASVIHEFAQSIGKENFYLLGEIAGSREFAFDTMQTTGLDGALGIDGVSPKMESVALGDDNPESYFDLFTNSKALGLDSHTWFRNTVVTMINDHDEIGRDKRRFCGEAEGWKAVVNGIALNALSLGIPCIYYGTEQGFDGDGGDDRALREAMFGGGYGSLESWHRHFFNETNWIYRATVDVLNVRKNKRALRRGRQYLRQISGNGSDFGYPRKLGDRLDSLVAWSRMFASDPEIVIAINTDRANPQTAWVTIDTDTHDVGETLTCIHAFDPLAACQGKASSQPADLKVEARNGKAVQITLPPAGLAIFEG